MKRLAIYCFFDKQKKFSSYNQYYLNSLVEISDKVILVANGGIESSASNDLKQQGINVISRNNAGFDFAAWRDAINSIPAIELQSYDEIILCNNSCYGPVTSWNNIWEKMKDKDCDFWGLYEHPETPEYPRHIQSYFYVLKKALFNSQFFREYLFHLPVAKSWYEAVLQEVNFTQDMEKAGFKSSSLFKSSQLIPNPTRHLPEVLLSQGFPLVKRKAFSSPINEIIEYSLVQGSRKALEWIRQQTSYPVDLIVEDLCRHLSSSQISLILGLLYPVSDNNFKIETEELTGLQYNVKIAVVWFSFYEDLIEHNLYYIKNFPVNSTIVVVSTKPNIIKQWKSLLEGAPELLERYNFIFRIQPNRGRNESAYWVTCHDIIESHDYVCCMHDKKSPAALSPIIGNEWFRHCCEHLVGTPNTINDILKIFNKDPWIGLIEPIEPLFANLQNIIIRQPWGSYRNLGEKFYNDLKLTVPFDDFPRAPWGGMFWVRGNAMKAFYRKNWSYEDFPEEPLRPDGTLLHVLERMYPSIVQESGYFTAQIVCQSQIGFYYSNLYFIAQSNLKISQYSIINSNEINVEEYKKHFPYIKKQIFKYIRGKILGKNKIKTQEIKKILRSYWKMKKSKLKLFK